MNVKSAIPAFATLLLSLILVACTSTSALPPAVQQSPAGRKLAIVSTIGDELHLKRTGTTVFGNKERTLTVAAWELDRRVAEQVAAHASTRGYQPVVLDDPLVRARFRDVDSEDSVQMWKIGEQRKTLAEFAQANGVDMLLLIAAPRYTDVIFGSNQKLESYGIYELSSLFVKQGVEYALVQLVVFDGHNGQQIGYQTEHARHERAAEDFLPDDLAVTPQELADLKGVIVQLYENLVAAQLAKLRL